MADTQLRPQLTKLHQQRHTQAMEQLQKPRAAPQRTLGAACAETSQKSPPGLGPVSASAEDTNINSNVNASMELEGTAFEAFVSDVAARIIQNYWLRYRRRKQPGKVSNPATGMTSWQPIL